MHFKMMVYHSSPTIFIRLVKHVNGSVYSVSDTCPPFSTCPSWTHWNLKHVRATKNFRAEKSRVAGICMCDYVCECMWLCFFSGWSITKISFNMFSPNFSRYIGWPSMTPTVGMRRTLSESQNSFKTIFGNIRRVWKWWLANRALRPHFGLARKSI